MKNIIRTLQRRRGDLKAEKSNTGGTAGRKETESKDLNTGAEKQSRENSSKL